MRRHRLRPIRRPSLPAANRLQDRAQFPVRPRPREFSSLPAPMHGMRLAQRDPHLECTAAADFAVQIDGAAMNPYDFLHHGEADTGALNASLLGSFASNEFIENA